MSRPAAAAAPAALSKRPKDTDFYQQRLKAWQPILTPKWVMISFTIVGIIFVIIGVILKHVSDSLVELRAQYDGDGADPNFYSSCHTDTGYMTKNCTVTLTATADMTAPVYVYYELANFYQNHRRYVKSVDTNQLSGSIYTDASSVSDCSPLTTASNGKILDPCGLIANSYFNDTFNLTTSGLQMLETDISWASDRQTKFVAIPWSTKQQYLSSIQWINQTYPDVQDVTNEHFIVWMRVAALPTFRKLYGRIQQTIPAGTVLSFDLEVNYPVSQFSGKKSLVVSTVSFMGGKNPFLGIAYIAVGATCLGLALLFAVRQFFGGRRLGDTAFLVWNTKR